MAALVLALPSCGGDDGSDDGTGPGDPTHPPRTYAMGWAPSAPRPDEALLLSVIDSMATVSDVAIVQQPVPWAALLAGEDMDDLVEERGQLADFLRAKGMDVVFLVDPLQGLDRRKEAAELVEAGRSLREVGIREMHEAWVRGIAERIRPEWLGLASEINTLAARGDPELYEVLRDMINGLAPEVRAISPATRVFVSFQADEATGALVDPIIDHFALIDDFDIDLLGLSSYPVFAFDAPDDVPDDYLDPFVQATELPLAMVEGGWSSEDVPWAAGSPEEQRAYVERYEELLDRVEAELWIGLTPTDLDVDAFPIPEAQREGLRNFAFMGIWDVELDRKPAFDAWLDAFERPLR